MRHSIRPASLCVCGLLAVAGPMPALADAASPAQGLLDNPFVISLGAFAQTTDVKARLDGETVNDEVDFDKTFGKANDATRWRIDGLWRITPTHHLRFMYFDNDQTRSKTVNDTIEWGDYTFGPGKISSQTKYTITALAYEYAFMRTPTYEVAGSFGVNYADISLRLSGNATFTDSDGNTHTDEFTSKQGNLPAPLPLLGLRAGWVVAPQWYVDLQGQWFKVNVDNVDGTVSDIRVGATYMFNPSFGIGMGYNRFYTTVNASRDTFEGKLKFGYSGLQAFVTGTF